MSVVRKSPSLVVRPSEPVVATAHIALSPYDKVDAGTPFSILLLFEHPVQEPAETIKRGLSQALVHYHPFAGRLAAEATTDQVHIKCTGQGVAFVAASADCAMKDAKLLDQPLPTALLDELGIYYSAEGCGHTDPLLVMQVTEFSCGGFVVGVTVNHAIADGAGVGQFLKAVGELARGLSPSSVVPVRSDDSLMRVTGIPPSIDAFFRFLKSSSIQPFDLALLDITVPSSLIRRIKEEAHSNGGQACTTFEAVTAVLWQCRTRAIISDPEAPTVLYFSANVRKHLGVQDGYYGNCSLGQLVVATSGSVAKGDVIDVVELIQRAKDLIPDLFNKDEMAPQQVVDAGVLSYNLFFVTCWRNLGLDGADFGGGRPARVMSYTPQRKLLPFCVGCPPCKGKDGSNVLSLCVKEEHAGAFLGELERIITCT